LTANVALTGSAFAMTDDPVCPIDLVPDLRLSGALPSPRARSTRFRILPMAAIAIAQVASITAAVSAPPQNHDGALAAWYRSLKAPNGSGCCDFADCRSTESRISATGYEAMIDNKWVAVPRERVLTQTSSPTGRAVVCYQPGTQIIYCFVRPPES